MLGLSIDTAQNLALVVAIALILLAALFAKVLIGNLAKIAAAVLLVAAAIFVWWQRSELQDCADSVREQAATATPGSTTCSVAGVELTFDVGD